MEVHYLVVVRVDQAELDKRNLRAGNVGRAAITADDVVETTLSDSLKHNWMTQDHKVRKVK